jgi:hypothetical protein
MSGFLIGMAIGSFGVIAMWCGGILSSHEDDDIAADAKFLLAMGTGILLAGCAFAVVAGVVYDDGKFPARHKTLVAVSHIDSGSVERAAIPLGY